MLLEKNWKLESVLRLLLGIFFVLCFGTLLATLWRGAVDPNGTVSVGRTILSALTFQVGVVALMWRFLFEHKVGWVAGFGLDRNTLKAIALGAAVMGLFLPVGWGLQMAALQLMERLGIEPSVQLALQAMKNSGSATEIVTLGLVTIVLAPIAEETLFRGVLYPTLKQYGFPRTALWGTSTLFAVIHFNLAIFLPLLLLALVLVWLYEKTDNLLAPITAHATFNAVNFAMFFVADEFARSLPAQS